MYSRRELLYQVPAAGLWIPFAQAAHTKPATTIKAVVFDGLAIFDARPMFSLVEQLFPERGRELANLWRARQFEYMWLRSLLRQYTDFVSVTADALVFAASALGLKLSNEDQARLMDLWLNLACWPDAIGSIRAFRNAGLRTGFLSNMSERMLESGIRNGGLDGCFDHVLSTDRVRAYKPDPRAYQMGVGAFRLRREEIAFVASAGWDAAGARYFGYRTFWANRQNQPAEELGAADIATGTTLSDLVAPLTGQQELTGQTR